MKPLIVVHFPWLNIQLEAKGPTPIRELWELYDTYIKTETKGDYYVLTFMGDRSLTEFKVEVFDTTGLPEIEIERIQAMVQAQISRYKPTIKDDKNNILRSEP